MSKHADDYAVERFAIAMKAKLADARAKGRGGWDDSSSCSVEHLAALLIGHIGKGNPGNFEDIANLAMMLHQRGADPAILAGKQPAQRMPELTDELRLILGRPNFSCIANAEALRRAGHKIEQKAEHEQAAVIHWLLGFYFSHGNQWAEAAKAALKEMRYASMLTTTKPEGGEA